MAYGNGGNSTITQMGSAAKPFPDVIDAPSHLRDALMTAETVGAQIHEVLNRIEKRLDAVLVPSPPTGVIAPVEGRPLRSPLHHRVEQLNEMLRGAVERIQALHQRIEL